jgi:hypothetical protein
MHPIDSGIRTNLIHVDRPREAASAISIHHDTPRTRPELTSWFRSASRLLHFERSEAASPCVDC